MGRGKDEDDNYSHPQTTAPTTLTSEAKSEAAASSWFSPGTPTLTLSSCSAGRWSALWCRVVQEGARHIVHLNQLVWTVNVHRYLIQYHTILYSQQLDLAFSKNVAKLLKGFGDFINAGTPQLYLK